MSKKLDELLTRERLTAPHYLAYSWVLDRMEPNQYVLDFGSRYSLLPTLLALRGCDVVCTDRDRDFWLHQTRLAEQYGVDPPKIELIETVFRLQPIFDRITACWAIQHNDVPDIVTLARRLPALLRPGGKLLIVASFTPGESFHQTKRPDPQWVLSWEGHSEFIIGPSRLKAVAARWFWYRHNTTDGDWLDGPDERANAVAYELVKE